MRKNKAFDYEGFCDRLRFLRESHDLSQNDMADLLLIERSTYASYETGRSLPSVCSIKVLCEKFQISADNLLGIKFSTRSTRRSYSPHKK